MNDNIILDGERIDEVNEKLRLIQKKDGLTFGTDAFLLAAYIKKQKYATAAELGCGTGIISLLCATREKLARIHAFEIQPDFVELTKRNISLNSLGDKIIPHLSDVREITPSDTDGEVDVVFSNPPYMLAESGKPNISEAKNIARHEIFGGISDFCACARRLLKHGGRFYCVWRPDRLTSLLSAMIENRLEPKEMIFVHADLKTAPSLVLICAKKGAAPSLTVAPPLILHEVGHSGSGRALTDAAQRIYDTMSFTE